MRKTMYKWIVIQDGEIVNSGILDEPVDVFVEEIFPKADSNADRSIWELQDYADKNLSKYNYTFKYKEIEIDFSDLVGE